MKQTGIQSFKIESTVYRIIRKHGLKAVKAIHIIICTSGVDGKLCISGSYIMQVLTSLEHGDSDGLAVHIRESHGIQGLIIFKYIPAHFLQAAGTDAVLLLRITYLYFI